MTSYMRWWPGSSEDPADPWPPPPGTVLSVVSSCSCGARERQYTAVMPDSDDKIRLSAEGCVGGYGFSTAHHQPQIRVSWQRVVRRQYVRPHP